MINKNLYFDDDIIYENVRNIERLFDNVEIKGNYRYEENKHIDIQVFEPNVYIHLRSILHFEQSKAYKNIFEILCEKLPSVKSKLFEKYIMKKTLIDNPELHIEMKQSDNLNTNNALKYIANLFQIIIVLFSSKDINVFYPGDKITFLHHFIYIYEDKQGFHYLYTLNKNDISHVLFADQYNIIKFILNKEVPLKNK